MYPIMHIMLFLYSMMYFFIDFVADDVLFLEFL